VIRTVVMLGVVSAVLAASPAFAAPGAKLRGLDKVSGAAETFEAPLNTPVRFGKLEVLVRACTQSPPEEQRPESTAFLEITQAEAGTRGTETVEPGAKLFQGWMFASSPALNALEHPAYDVWVISCTS